MTRATACRYAAVVAASIACIAGRAIGHGMIPQDTPIDRIVENLKGRIAENPDDAEGYYVLGRAHALVYEYKDRNVRMWQHRDLPAEDGWQRQLAQSRPPVPPTPEELRNHLKEAITNLNIAIEKDPAQARYHLALASILDAGVSLAGEIDVYPGPSAAAPENAPGAYWAGLAEKLGDDAESIEQVRRALRGHAWDQETPNLRDQLVPLLHKAAASDDPKRAALAKQLLVEDWREQITEGYFRAMCLALPVNGKADEKPIWGSMPDWVAYEAATDYVRVVQSRPVRDDERLRLSVAKATVAAFDNLPRPRGITPIVLRLDAAPSIDACVAPHITTTFDLDGTGRPLRWTWVKPDTALLVWDPERTGRITSGRQLFGNATWWLLFRHGYEALDALDDNRDGRIAGKELRGLSLWLDRDSDGVSDPGEVEPVETFGIAELSAAISGFDGATPMNAAGVRFHDGRVLPTYDWIAETVSPDSGGTPGAWLGAIVGLLPVLGGVALHGSRRASR